MIKNKKISLNDGIEVIKSELITIPSKPGIYQMIGENEEYLYISRMGRVAALLLCVLKFNLMFEGLKA